MGAATAAAASGTADDAAVAVVAVVAVIGTTGPEITGGAKAETIAAGENGEVAAAADEQDDEETGPPKDALFGKPEAVAVVALAVAEEAEEEGKDEDLGKREAAVAVGGVTGDPGFLAPCTAGFFTFAARRAEATALPSQRDATADAVVLPPLDDSGGHSDGASTALFGGAAVLPLLCCCPSCGALDAF